MNTTPQRPTTAQVSDPASAAASDTASETTASPTPQVALIGGGVRGTAALARLVARLTHLPASPEGPERALTVHFVDPHPLGSGRIWRADQPHTLVMNTVAAQSTVFDDETLDFADRCPGPTFAQWCAGIGDGTYAFTPTESAGDVDDFTVLAAQTQPWDSPSRALYGAYLRWAHAHLISQLPKWVAVRTHAASATRLTRVEGVNGTQSPRFHVGLSSGSVLTVHAVLLAVGWLPRPSSDPVDVGAESPIDQAVDRIAPGDTVAVRGVGMGFTDLLSLVTESRGGRYVAQPLPERPFAVRYVPSGNEPHLYAGSRTGVPFLAKPAFGAVPPVPEFVSLRAWLPTLIAARTAGPLDFAALVLPLIERDSARAHYRALAAHRPEAFSAEANPLLAVLDTPPALPAEAQPLSTAQHDTLADALAHDATTWQGLARQIVASAAHRFDASHCDAPLTGRTADDIDTEIVARIAADAADASLGARSARKMGLHVYQAARAAIVPLTDFWGVSDTSTRAHDQYLTRAGLAGSGPPLFRVEQLLAAHEAGVVHFVGPDLQVTVEGDQRWVSSRRAPDARVAVDRVADAFLSLPDGRTSADPLLISLCDQHLTRAAISPSGATTAALDLTPEASQLIDAAGAPVPGLYSVGVLHEHLRRFTIIAPIPGARSTVLREIDAAVGALLDELPHPV